MNDSKRILLPDKEIFLSKSRMGILYRTFGLSGQKIVTATLMVKINNLIAIQNGKQLL
jgi:hypothetical protein